MVVRKLARPDSLQTIPEQLHAAEPWAWHPEKVNVVEWQSLAAMTCPVFTGDCA